MSWQCCSCMGFVLEALDIQMLLRGERCCTATVRFCMTTSSSRNIFVCTSTLLTNLLLIQPMLHGVCYESIGSGRFRGRGSKVSTELHFGLHLVLRSTDNGTVAPSPATKLRNWRYGSCFSRKFVRKSIDWTGWAGSCSQKQSKWA